MKIGNYTLSDERPAIMGILNVTPDSFSDGGMFVERSRAIDHALKLTDDGADIIDIGGESSRPGADSVSAEVELPRVIPVVEGIRKKSGIPISIDTTKALVAARAIDTGADMINDISAGLFDREMLPLAASSQKPICLMHMKGTARTMQDAPHYDDVIREIAEFLADSIDRAARAGVSRNGIFIDPGIGFGKTALDNVTIIRNLKEFAGLGCPLVVGASKKSFIGKLLDLDIKERLEATLATIPQSIEGGARVLRLHDVRAARRFIDMYMICRPCRIP